MWYMKFIYAILLIISLFFLVLYDGIFSVLLFCVLLLLPVTQFWMIRHVRKRLSIDLQVKQSEVEREQLQTLLCTLQNRSFFPLNYCHVILKLENKTINETECIQLQLPLQAHFSATVSFQTNSAHCGHLHVSVQSCRIADYLHLFTKAVRSCTIADYIVLPKEQGNGYIMQTNRCSEIQESMIYDPIRPGDDNTELFGIREFRDTDNPKRIHWKRSSRQEMLFVKEYSRPMERQHLFLIDYFQSNKMSLTGEQLDAQMELLHAVACICLRQQIPFSIAWNTAENELQCRSVTTITQLQQCIICMLETDTHTTCSAITLLKKQPLAISYAAVIHIAHNDTEEIELPLQQYGWQIHVFTNADTIKPEIGNVKKYPVTIDTLQTTLSAICNL